MEIKLSTSRYEYNLQPVLMHIRLFALGTIMEIVVSVQLYISNKLQLRHVCFSVAESSLNSLRLLRSIFVN